jgi:hypothetical protein
VKIERTTAFTDYLTWIKNGGNYSAEVLKKLTVSMEADAGHTKHDGTGRFRPSLIGDQCDRKQMLSFLYQNKGEGNWYSYAGTWLHLAFQTFLLDTYKERLRIEYPVAPDKGAIGVTGKCDWYWPGEGISIPDRMTIIDGPHIGDYKGSLDAADLLEKVKEEHIAQLTYQMYTMGVKHGYLVYQGRGHGNMANYHIEMERDDWVPLHAKLERLYGYAEAGEMPPMLEPCRFGSGPFKECRWTDICLRREREDVERGRHGSD